MKKTREECPLGKDQWSTAKERNMFLLYTGRDLLIRCLRTPITAKSRTAPRSRSTRKAAAAEVARRIEIMTGKNRRPSPEISSVLRME
nr:hypothetical protein Itr_chr15CG01090 [Ipomoea trifida]